MSAKNAEEFITKLINDSKFQVEALKVVKAAVGSLDSLLGTKDEKEILKAALPAANEMGYECTAEELRNAFDTVTKKAGPFKMIGFAASMMKNAKKVNEG